MSTTGNEIWLQHNDHLVRLDLPEDTDLLSSFAANDRARRVDGISSDYARSSAPLIRPATTRCCVTPRPASPRLARPMRAPCVLVSDGVERLPLATLLIKGHEEGEHLLQITGITVGSLSS
jgi:hypothetical protein